MAEADASTFTHYLELLKALAAEAADGLVHTFVSGGPAFYVIVIGVLLFAIMTFAFVRWATT